MKINTLLAPFKNPRTDSPAIPSSIANTRFGSSFRYHSTKLLTLSIFYLKVKESIKREGKKVGIFYRNFQSPFFELGTIKHQKTQCK